MFIIAIAIFSIFLPYAESSVFSYGRLLHDVQTNNVFKDPRTFLRLRLQRPENEILRDFENFNVNGLPCEEKKRIIQEFIENNFRNVSGVEHWKPQDFQRKPKLLTNIFDPKMKAFFSKLNEDWLKFGRKLIKDVYTNSGAYSFIAIQHPFFVASDSDKEMGYWESYWIFQGLMACEMYESARFLLENILELIKKLGYCPPYNRIYYKGRLSPPLLAIMIEQFVRRTNSSVLITTHLPLIDKEFAKWMEARASILSSPFHSFLVVSEEIKTRLRPEAYSEDLISLHRSAEPKPVGPKELFWTRNRNIEVVSVADCCVTARAARILSVWLRESGHKARARYLQEVSDQLNYTLNNLLKVGDCWRDLHLQNGFKAAGWMSKWPVWSGLMRSGCEGMSHLPLSGPEALLAGYPSSHEWLATFHSSTRRSLVDTASALRIAATTPNITLRHIITVKRTMTTGRPKLTRYLLYPMVFYLAAKLFELLARLVVTCHSTRSQKTVSIRLENFVDKQL